MNYAIEQLKQYAAIMSNDRITKKVSYDFIQSAKRLEQRNNKFKYSYDVRGYLDWLRIEIKNGLKNWSQTDNIEVKRRQENRLKDVEEAIKFIDR